MTKNEAKQKVLDAIADLAQVPTTDSNDYFEFLGDVEEAVYRRLTQLIVVETAHVAESVEEEIDAVAAADHNLAPEEPCCGFGCGSACTGFGRADHEDFGRPAITADDKEEDVILFTRKYPLGVKLKKE